jgi:hypothetical protein
MAEPANLEGPVEHDPADIEFLEFLLCHALPP